MMKSNRKQIAPAVGSFAVKAGNMLFLVCIMSGWLFFDCAAVAAVMLPGKGECAVSAVGVEPVSGKGTGDTGQADAAVFGKESRSFACRSWLMPLGKKVHDHVPVSGREFVGKADFCLDENRAASESAGKAGCGIVQRDQVRSAEFWFRKVESGFVPVVLAEAGKAEAGGSVEYVREVASAAGKAAESDLTDDLGGDSDVVAGVRVSLQGFDAELMKEIARLREEKARLQEEVRELELARRSLSAENEGLRRELIEALQIIAGQNEKLLRLKSGIAGMYDAEGIEASGGEDARNLELLKMVSLSGSDLAVAVAEFCREIESSLDGWQLDDAGKAKVRLQINHVRALAGKFSALNDWERGNRDIENVRILAVDKNLGAVILPAGTASGIFNGLVCSVPAVPGVKLKIVAVRRFVSAAVFTAGDPDSIAVGMKVVAKANAKTEEN